MSTICGSGPYDFDTLEDLNDAVEAQVNWLNHEKTPYRGINERVKLIVCGA